MNSDFIMTSWWQGLGKGLVALFIFAIIWAIINGSQEEVVDGEEAEQ